MTATSPRLHARSRWSQAVKCPRQGAYGLLGVDPDEQGLRDTFQRRGLDLEGLRRRGRQLGAERYERYALKYGAENVIPEKAVPWPAGVLHPDVFVIPERLTVEVKSSASPASVIDDALLQLAGQVHYDDDSEGGLLEVVSPIDLSVVEAIPLLLNDEWVERVEKVAAQVVRAGATRGAELPDRVCRKPSDGVGRFCPFVYHCFADWQPPTVEELEVDTDVLALVGELYAVKKQRKTLSEQDKPLEATVKDLQARLDETLQPGTYKVGPFALKVSPRTRETFSLKRAAGSVPAEILDPFTTVSAWRAYDIEKVDAGPVPDQFGEDTPF